MEKKVTPRVCSIARTLELVGEKWSLLVLREVFLGERRFEGIAAHTGAPRDVLSARLKSLVQAGVLDRVPYQEHPPRYEYRLTPAGRDLQPVILALMRWGDQHLDWPEGPPRVLTHECGHDFEAELTCAACHQPVAGTRLRPKRAEAPSPAGSTTGD